MATQKEVIDFIKANYKYEDLGDGFFKLLFDTGEDRSQLVLVEVNDEMLTYSSSFASVDEITAKRALEVNSDFRLGMKVIGDSYWVRHVAFLDDIDASEIENGFHFVAQIADEIEEVLLGSDDR